MSDDLLNDVALLVDFDRIDEPIDVVVIVIGDRFGKALVDGFQLVLQDPVEPQQDR